MKNKASKLTLTYDMAARSVEYSMFNDKSIIHYPEVQDEMIHRLVGAVNLVCPKDANKDYTLEDVRPYAYALGAADKLCHRYVKKLIRDGWDEASRISALAFRYHVYDCITDTNELPALVNVFNYMGWDIEEVKNYAENATSV